MEWVTIYEIGKLDIFNTLFAILCIITAIGYVYAGIVTNRVISRVASAVLIIGCLLLFLSCSDRDIKKAYHSEELNVAIIEGTIENYESDFQGCTFSVDDYNILANWYPPDDHLDWFVDRNRILEENGQHVRITIKKTSLGNDIEAIFKVEVAKQDIPSKKLIRLQGKYGNSYNLLE